MLPILYTTKLSQIYPPEQAIQVVPRLHRLIERYRLRIPTPADTSLSERDAILITYTDQVRQEDVWALP